MSSPDASSYSIDRVAPVCNGRVVVTFGLEQLANCARKGHGGQPAQTWSADGQKRPVSRLTAQVLRGHAPCEVAPAIANSACGLGKTRAVPRIADTKEE